MTLTELQTVDDNGLLSVPFSVLLLTSVVQSHASPCRACRACHRPQQTGSVLEHCNFLAHAKGLCAMKFTGSDCLNDVWA